MPPLILRPTAQNQMIFGSNKSNQVGSHPRSNTNPQYPNEPSGMTTLFDDPMQELPGTPGVGPGQWIYDDPPVTGHDAVLVTDTSPLSEHSAWEIPYLTSLSGGSEPFRAYTGVTISPQTERMLYDCVVFKYSANWDNSTNVATKFSYFRNGGGTNHYWTARWEPGAGISLSFSTQGAGPTIDYVGRPGVDVIPDDTWARVEILRTCNSPAGTANGTFRMWYSTWTGSAWTTPVEALFNKNYTGSYISRQNEVLWADTGNPTAWDYLAWTGVYGGGGASPPVNMSLQIAHWYASAK